MSQQPLDAGGIIDFSAVSRIETQTAQRATCAAGRRATQQFCRWCLGCVVACVSIVVGLEILLDPCWIYRGPWSSYWHPLERQLMSRVNKGEVAAHDPITVALMGDSRMLWGINPLHPRLAARGKTYNFGMVGSSIHEACACSNCCSKIRNADSNKSSG